MEFRVGFQIIVVSTSLLFGDAVRGVLSQTPSIGHDGKVTIHGNTTTYPKVLDVARSRYHEIAQEASALTSIAGGLSQSRTLSFSLLHTLSLHGSHPVSDGVMIFIAFLLGAALVIVIAILLWLFGWRVVFSKKLDAREQSMSEDSDEESWVSAQLVDNMLAQATSIDIEFIKPSWTAPTIKKILQDFKINTQRWTPEHFDFFARELSKGRARLCKDGDTLLRVLDMVVVLLTYEPEDLAIQEVVHATYKRGGFEELPEKTLKTRLNPGENPVGAAARSLFEKLDLDENDLEDHIQINPDILNMRESKEFNDSLPGLTSLVRYYVVEASVTSADDAFLERLGIPSRSCEHGEYMYTWEKTQELPRVRKHVLLKSASALRQKGIRWNMLQHSLIAVMPWNDIELARELGKYGLNALMPFGKPFENLLKGLQEGRLTLGVRGNVLWCVSQEVSVVVYSRSGKVLVTEDSLRAKVSSPSASRKASSKQMPRIALPSIAKYSNEGTWMAAFRLAQIDFKLSVPIFSMEAHLISVADHLNLQDDTVRREFIVSGPAWPGH
jgi:hypothetical protein